MCMCQMQLPNCLMLTCGIFNFLFTCVLWASIQRPVSGVVCTVHNSHNIEDN